MSWFVLVPGTNHGGWWYDAVAHALRARGHVVDAVTLTGLDPCGPPAPAANLDTHIADVLALLDSRPEQAVLVGHGYAGSVITGAADRGATRVETLVYLDAFVPDDGDSCWTMTLEWQRDWFTFASGPSGLAVEPMPFLDARTRPQPLGTLLQRSRLTGAWRSVPHRHYVVATGVEWEKRSPYLPVAERLREDPAWTVTELDATHDLLAGGADPLVGLLLALA